MWVTQAFYSISFPFYRRFAQQKALFLPPDHSMERWVCCSAVETSRPCPGFYEPKLEGSIFYPYAKGRDVRCGCRIMSSRNNMSKMPRHAGMGLGKPKLTWTSVWQGPMKSNKKGFSRYMCRRKTRANLGLFLTGTGSPVTKNMEKVEIYAFSSVFTGKIFIQEPQVLDTKSVVSKKICSQEMFRLGNVWTNWAQTSPQQIAYMSAARDGQWHCEAILNHLWKITANGRVS